MASRKVMHGIATIPGNIVSHGVHRITLPSSADRNTERAQGSRTGAGRAVSGPGQGPASLVSIYRPVRPEMVELEKYLDRVVDSAPPELAEQLGHALKVGGKRIRPGITMLAGKFHKYNVDLLLPMAAALELLHTATLLHDDTIDDSHLRRGRLTANRLWGDANAVLLGDYLCAAAARMVAELGKVWSASAIEVAEARNVRAMELLAQTIMNICSGAIEESLHPYNMSREHYFRRIGNKTASLFCAAAESGALLSEAPDKVVESFRDYGYNLGMGFQVVDDILDFSSDVRRGSFTLPAILLLERPEGAWLKEVLEEDKEGGVRLLVEAVYDSAIMDECSQVARDFCSGACQALEQLPRISARESLVSLSDYIAQRDS